MKRKRWLLLVVVAFLLLVIFLRELGVLDWNLYKSEVATDRVATSVLNTPVGAGPAVSYDLSISYESEQISTTSHRVGGTPTLEIDVDLVPTVSGNYWVPFYKSFSVEYSTSFESSAEDTQYSLHGDITGSVDLTIIGLCTRRKALELAREEIVGGTQDYFEDQLGSDG